jgi:hypothetical protein
VPESSATFNIDLAGNAADQSAKTAAAMEASRAAIEKAKEALGRYSNMMGLLKGKDAETLSAREKLNAAILKEKAAINSNALAIAKLGGNYSELAQEAKRAAKAADESGVAMRLAKVGSDLLSGGMVVATAAIAAFVAGVVGGAVAFSKWVLGAADVNRSLELVREGAVNSGKEAQNLGGIVDQLAKKSPLAKAEINDLATSLYRTFNNTSSSAKVGGQIIEDTLSLVTTATSAANAQVGNQLKSIVERGKMIQRLQLGRQDLFGTGVKVEDVAGALAKNMKVGVKEAQQALLEGRVSLSDGVHALNEAVEKRFGEINARKMLSADVIFKKFHETLVGFTAGVNLEPLAAAAGKFFGLFNDENAVGASLKKITEVLGNDLVGTLAKLEDKAEEVFLRVVNAGLDVTIWAYENKAALKDMFDAAGTAGGLFFSVIKEVGVELGRIAQLVVKVGQGIGYLGDKLGLIDAQGATANSQDKSRELMKADHDRRAAARDLDISGNQRSGPGFGTTEVAPANAGGGEVLRPAPGEAFASVAPGEHIVPAGASVGGSGGGGGGGAILNVNVSVAMIAGKQAEKAAAVASSPSFLAELTHTLEHAFQASGITVQAVPT